MKPFGAISSDIDTLHSIYKGRGLRRPAYTYVEFQIGLENFSRFLEPYGIKATLFVVGHDLLQPQNQDAARAMVADGHEIANHTHTHAQGFRLLAEDEQEREIAGMEGVCLQVTGRRPVGFRSPGWNIGDTAVAILKRRGYVYDSSIHPMSVTPLFKALHWISTRNCTRAERTTLGQLEYMFAPLKPYRTSLGGLARTGSDGVMEFPVSVVPGVRMPFWATFLLATGFDLFKASYHAIRVLSLPLQYQFHLSDFVDYGHPDLADQVPPPSSGVYVPQALRMPLARRMDLFTRAMDIMAPDYDFVTLERWADAIA